MLGEKLKRALASQFGAFRVIGAALVAIEASYNAHNFWRGGFDAHGWARK